MIFNAGGIKEFVDWIDFRYGKMMIRSINELLYDTDTSHSSKQEIVNLKANQDLPKLNYGNVLARTREHRSWSPYRMFKSIDSKNIAL